MKLSKIILLSFFCLCLAVSLFYTFKVFGAESKTGYVTDYSALKFDREINTIIIEDGWNISASVGPDAYLRSDRAIGFYLEADSIEKVLLTEAGNNGYVLNRYISEYDDSILNNIELRGDSLVFSALSGAESSLLGEKRLRLNLTNVENINMIGDSYMNITGANSKGSLQLKKINVSLLDQAYVGISQIGLDSLTVSAKDRSGLGLIVVGTRDYINSDGEVIEVDQQLSLNPSIELSDMSKMSVRVRSAEWKDLKLKDEAHIVFPSDNNIVVTKDGVKYSKR